MIETLPIFSYCGECVAKDISASISEVEIELLKEYQHQGISYKAITRMLNKLVKEYEKIEPYNYESQFLLSV